MPSHAPAPCTFRFYAELNDFLAASGRGREIVWPLRSQSSVKDTIEALGIPHTEVDLILVDGAPAGFSRLLSGGERIAVYPPFRNIEIDAAARLRPVPFFGRGFVLDVHLGRLARYLRLLGFDALYRNDYSDTEIARLAATEQRAVLTRDRGLLKQAAVRRGHWLRATAPRDQVREVIDAFDLGARLAPFTRCMACNNTLEPTTREMIVDRVPGRVAREFAEFRECRSCRRVYWRGSHYDRLTALLAEWTAGGAGAAVRSSRSTAEPRGCSAR